MIRAFLLDDEPLATKRLQRMLEETGRVLVTGVAHDPVDALEQVKGLQFDALFLDIQMPGLNGFEFLARVSGDPLVVFTTAFNEYALQAFEVNSIDYLVKPVEAEKLERAIRKLERMLGEGTPRPPVQDLVKQLTAALQHQGYPERLSSKVGDKIEFIELDRVTHIYAEDKLTYAATAHKSHVIDLTIADLETKLDPRKFVRIHRSTIVNVAYVQELYSYFGGKMLLRLKDAAKTELTVSRERARDLKEKLGL